MSKQALNCLNVFALVDKKGCEAVAEVVEAESLPRLKSDANLNRGWANFVFRHHAVNLPANILMGANRVRKTPAPNLIY